MKTLRFTTDLKFKILSGEKRETWRLFDDKDLQVGDELEFFESGKDKSFAYARIIKITEKS